MSETLTDEHHDWTTGFCGIDTRASDSAGDANPSPPAAPEQTEQPAGDAAGPASDGTSAVAQMEAPGGGGTPSSAVQPQAPGTGPDPNGGTLPASSGDPPPAAPANNSIAAPAAGDAAGPAPDSTQTDGAPAVGQMESPGGGGTPVSVVQPQASGIGPVANPYAGTNLETVWAQGFQDGFAEPDSDHPPPSPLTPDAQTVYREGVLAGQNAARPADGGGGTDPNAGSPPANSGDSPPAAPADNSTAGRFLTVFQKVGNKLGGDIGTKLSQVSPLEVAGFAAVFILIEDTPLGWAATLAGAALIGREIIDVIGDITDFISITVNPNGDLDDAASHLSSALARVAVDVLIAWLTHKASGAVKPYVKPPNGFVDVVTPDGLVVRVPNEAPPDNTMLSEGSGEQGGGGGGLKKGSAAAKKLGNMAGTAVEQMTVREAILSRGGKGSNVQVVASRLQGMKVADVAKLAVDGDAEAETAIKIIKQASQKAQDH